MKLYALTADNIHAYREVLPSQLDAQIQTGGARCIGAEFAGTPAGAAVWAELPDEDHGKLLSVYVLPEARRLGIGWALVREVVQDMVKRGKKGISLQYSADGDRLGLAPFMNEVGLRTTVHPVALGRIRLGDVAEWFSKFGEITPVGSALGDLAPDERGQVIRWIAGISGELPQTYLSGHPESFVVLRNHKVRAALLLREEQKPDGMVLSLDYAVSEDSRELMGLLRVAEQSLSGMYGPETPIEMLLMSRESERLYERLFGEPEAVVFIGSCRQDF